LHQRQIKIPIYPAVSRSVLIADDSPSMRRSVQFLLERHRTELRIGEAVDGVDAIEKARGTKPDLILLDLAMPRLNGVEAASILKRILPKTPIILFAMHTDVHADSLSAFINVDSVSKVDGVMRLLERVDALLPPIARAPEQRPDSGGHIFEFRAHALPDAWLRKFLCFFRLTVAPSCVVPAIGPRPGTADKVRRFSMQAAPMQAAPQDVGASIQEYFDASKGTDEAKFPAHYSDDVVLQLPPGTLDGLNALVFLIAEGSLHRARCYQEPPAPPVTIQQSHLVAAHVVVGKAF
jgi:CheY-like chemotaxis protein